MRFVLSCSFCGAAGCVGGCGDCGSDGGFDGDVGVEEVEVCDWIGAELESGMELEPQPK